MIFFCKLPLNGKFENRNHLRCSSLVDSSVPQTTFANNSLKRTAAVVAAGALLSFRMRATIAKSITQVTTHTHCIFLIVCCLWYVEKPSKTFCFSSNKMADLAQVPSLLPPLRKKSAKYLLQASLNIQFQKSRNSERMCCVNMITTNSWSLILLKLHRRKLRWISFVP